MTPYQTNTLKPSPLIDELHAVREQLWREANGDIRTAIHNAHVNVSRYGLDIGMARVSPAFQPASISRTHALDAARVGL